MIADSAISTWPASSGLPVSDNGLLGPANNTLNPNQSATFSSNNNLLPFLVQADRPGQLEITWSSAKPALTLWVGSARISRVRDTSTFQILAERSRSIRECRSIILN